MGDIETGALSEEALAAIGAAALLNLTPKPESITATFHENK